MFSLRLLHVECFSCSNPTLCSFIMSSCCINNFFELMHGRCMDTDVNKPDGSVVTTKHNFYETCVVCSDAILMPAELHKYSPVKEVILRDKTVAYVIAKLNVPPARGPLLLEAWHVTPVPEDPHPSTTTHIFLTSRGRLSLDLALSPLGLMTLQVVLSHFP